MTAGDDSGDLIADRKANVTISAPLLIGQGFMTYERYDVSIGRDGEPPLLQQRDVVRASHVAAVLAIDLARNAVVLIRQFRLPAHLATGRGDMVEIVAGRVDHGETPAAAARRECIEEIGVAPERVAELFSVLATPGFTDEYVTFFAGFVDSAAVLTRGGLADENEDTHPFVVSIDEALAALDRGKVANALLYTALQWLALNRERLQQHFSRAA
jgi:ADP-ribose pyrophosphatase